MAFIHHLSALAVASVAFGLPITAGATPTEEAPLEHPLPRESRAGEAGFGVHWQWAQGKAMPGITLRVGRGLWSGVFETSLIWLTEPDPARRHRFLGSQLGAFLMVRPVHVGRVDLAAGLGLDYYPLWNIHGDEWQLALAARASGHFWISSDVGLFGTARYYPVSTRGVELGTHRDGSLALPVLFGTGIEWRTR